MDAQSPQDGAAARRSSQGSQASDDSHTALDFIRSQLQLEADAREALPYSIDHCTKPLGRLRQSVFACLTCNPPPADPTQPYTRPAGVCYACSVQCHGDHTLVELFNKRNFTCDCGTTRFSSASPCRLRGNVHSEAADAGNQYNHNFRNRFCGCACDYDPFQQKGTMFQCLGLGTHATGGCGEDWWHPGCVVGLGPKWSESAEAAAAQTKAKEVRSADAADAAASEPLPTIAEDADGGNNEAGADGEKEDDDDDEPLPPGFPKEDDFEGFICYKCVDAFPWIRQYAGAPGFLPAVFRKTGEGNAAAAPAAATTPVVESTRKRKAEDDAEDDAGAAGPQQEAKRVRSDETADRDQDGKNAKKAEQDSGERKEGAAAAAAPTAATPACKRKALPPSPAGQFSLFFTESFRDRLCRCRDCFPLLQPHPQLLEEEETYEPPVSEDGEGEANGAGAGGGSGDGAGSENGRSGSGGSLYERGESALRNVDRVRAIEGVMAYNHLKDKLKPFFQQFAESGQAISAEDIKAYFAKLRGDEQAIREAGDAVRSADSRHEQSGH